MSKEELGRLTLITGSLDGKYTVSFMAKKLGISERQVKRLKRAVRENGDGTVIHGNSGRHPANYKSEELRQRIIGLKRSNNYNDANFTYFRELLLERENIKIGYTTLSAILKGAGIVSKKTHRVGGQTFKRRKRRSAFGELLQADATPYDWWGTGTRQALHGYIDDATGRLVGLYMCQNECLQGYLEALRQVLKIGRSSSNDIIVHDPTVSSHHANITISGTGEVRVKDLNSKNGTYINGQRIYQETLITAKDVVKAGNSVVNWQKHLNAPKPIRQFPVKVPEFLQKKQVCLAYITVITDPTWRGSNPAGTVPDTQGYGL
ncbi:hypothetical protein FACS189445_5900 [Spirochaetia bacterium]|nr:hypothetical protein FACS189445_5900 [Spirochaetia bacterium]